MTTRAISLSATELSGLAAREPLLFDQGCLPETPSRRAARRGRRTPVVAESVAEEVVREAVPRLMTAPPSIVRVVEREPFDPAQLSSLELRALVRRLPDHTLAGLLVDAACEARRRLESGEGEDGDEAQAEPDPGLLRAARRAAGELGGEDI